MPSEEKANKLLQLGIELAKAGEVDEAMKLFGEALDIVPGNPVVNYNCGLAQQQAGSIEAAVISYRAAIGVLPEFAEARINLSYALKLLGRFSEALQAAEGAIQLDGNEPSAWLAKGNALRSLHALGQAAEAFQTGVELAPTNGELKLSLANTKRELGQVPEAIRLLREVSTEHPEFAESHRDLAHALLLNGEYLEGWHTNRWRWSTRSLRGGKRHQSITEWTGQPLTGKRILLWDEQGFGDAIQFVRFVPWVAEMGAEVLLEVQPGLVRLFETVEGVSAVFARDGTLPRVDYQASLLDLGDVFCTELSAIPNATAYLHVERSVEKLDGDRPKVGLCWAGNPNHDNDRNRSIDLKLLEPLLNLPGIDFFSLQIGSQAGETVSASKLQKLPGELGDFLDTARFVVALDIVITVDSSIVHLAGALGQAVWVLLPYAPDWRWLLGREDSPWYPSASLFRQSQPGDWAVPIQEMCKRITEKLVND